MTFTMVGMVIQKKRREKKNDAKTAHLYFFLNTRENLLCRQFILLCRVGAFVGL